MAFGGLETRGVQLVQADALGGDAKLFQDALDARCPELDGLIHVDAAGEEVPDLSGPDAQFVGVLGAGHVAEEDGCALAGDEGVALEAAQVVGAGGSGAGGVAHVDGVEHENAAEVQSGHLALEPGKAVSLEPCNVDPLLEIDHLLPYEVLLMRLLRHGCISLARG